jgi:hypothetical protein
MNLKALESKRAREVLQRTFLHIADILRHSDVEPPGIIAALLGAAIQDYIENELLGEVEAAKKNLPGIPPTFAALYNFMRAFGTMMANQGCSAGIVGLAMSHAGLDVAKKEFSAEIILNNMQSKLEVLVEGK